MSSKVPYIMHMHAQTIGLVSCGMIEHRDQIRDCIMFIPNTYPKQDLKLLV